MRGASRVGLLLASLADLTDGERTLLCEAARTSVPIKGR